MSLLLSMDTTGLRENFNNQLKEIEEKLIQIRVELKKAEEYKLKLTGGLETIELLEQQSGADIPPPQPAGYRDPLEVEDPLDPKYRLITKENGDTENVIVQDN